MSGMEPQPSRGASGTAPEHPDDWIREALACHEASLLRYAYSLTQDVETAQDVVQDTFLKLCEQPRETVAPFLVRWLFTVCRNRAVDALRKSGRTGELSEDEMNHQSAGGLNPAEATELRDSSAWVSRLLEGLPFNQREVVRLKFQSQLSYQEIADVTRLSVTNVGFLLHTALKTLRQRWETVGPPRSSHRPSLEKPLSKAP